MSQNPGVVLVKEQKVIHVQSAFPIIPKFQNFSSIVTANGQTVFTLPSYPILTGLICVNINGVLQDPLNGDYTVNGNVLTMNANLSIGDKVAGFYQQQEANVPPGTLGYATFFLTATQGQTQFNVGFTFQAIVYVSINGILQALTQDYSQSGQIITMTQPLNAGDKFFGLVVL